MPEVVRANVDLHEGHASPSPGPFHQTSYTGGSPNVFANNQPIIRGAGTDSTVCGDPAVELSSNVFKYSKLSAFTTFISLLFLLVIYLCIQMQVVPISLFLFSIISISVITLPHAIIMTYFYD